MESPSTTAPSTATLLVLGMCAACVLHGRVRATGDGATSARARTRLQLAVVVGVGAVVAAGRGGAAALQTGEAAAASAWRGLLPLARLDAQDRTWILRTVDWVARGLGRVTGSESLVQRYGILLFVLSLVFSVSSASLLGRALSRVFPQIAAIPAWLSARRKRVRACALTVAGAVLAHDCAAATNVYWSAAFGALSTLALGLVVDDLDLAHLFLATPTTPFFPMLPTAISCTLSAVGLRFQSLPIAVLGASCALLSGAACGVFPPYEASVLPLSAAVILPAAVVVGVDESAPVLAGIHVAFGIVALLLPPAQADAVVDACIAVPHSIYRNLLAPVIALIRKRIVNPMARWVPRLCRTTLAWVQRNIVTPLEDNVVAPANRAMRALPGLATTHVFRPGRLLWVRLVWTPARSAYHFLHASVWRPFTEQARRARTHAAHVGFVLVVQYRALEFLGLLAACLVSVANVMTYDSRRAVPPASLAVASIPPFLHTCAALLTFLLPQVPGIQAKSELMMTHRITHTVVALGLAIPGVFLGKRELLSSYVLAYLTTIVVGRVALAFMLQKKLSMDIRNGRDDEAMAEVAKRNDQYMKWAFATAQDVVGCVVALVAFGAAIDYQMPTPLAVVRFAWAFFFEPMSSGPTEQQQLLLQPGAALDWRMVALSLVSLTLFVRSLLLKEPLSRWITPRPLLRERSASVCMFVGLSLGSVWLNRVRAPHVGFVSICASFGLLQLATVALLRLRHMPNRARHSFLVFNLLGYAHFLAMAWVPWSVHSIAPLFLGVTQGFAQPFTVGAWLLVSTGLCERAQQLMEELRPRNDVENPRTFMDRARARFQNHRTDIAPLLGLLGECAFGLLTNLSGLAASVWVLAPTAIAFAFRLASLHGTSSDTAPPDDVHSVSESSSWLLRTGKDILVMVGAQFCCNVFARRVVSWMRVFVGRVFLTGLMGIASAVAGVWMILVPGGLWFFPSPPLDASYVFLGTLFLAKGLDWVAFEWRDHGLRALDKPWQVITTTLPKLFSLSNPLLAFRCGIALLLHAFEQQHYAFVLVYLLASHASLCVSAFWMGDVLGMPRLSQIGRDAFDAMGAVFVDMPNRAILQPAMRTFASLYALGWRIIDAFKWAWDRVIIAGLVRNTRTAFLRVWRNPVFSWIASAGLMALVFGVNRAGWDERLIRALWWREGGGGLGQLASSLGANTHALAASGLTSSFSALRTAGDGLFTWLVDVENGRILENRLFVAIATAICIQVSYLKLHYAEYVPRRILGLPLVLTVAAMALAPKLTRATIVLSTLWSVLGVVVVNYERRQREQVGRIFADFQRDRARQQQGHDGAEGARIVQNLPDASGVKVFDTESCVICYEDFPPDRAPVAATLLCGHQFHTSCIGSWLTHQARCPVCRAPVTSRPANVVANLF